MKLLLHTCCGPCFLGVWEDLKLSNFEITNYFYNPNIQPMEEYQKRLDNLKKATVGRSKEILEEKYNKKEHLQAIRGKEKNFGERCLRCYELRLEKTAQKAKEQNFDAFSTTLLVSPYQQHEALKEIGEALSQKYQLQFYYRDFRGFFREGQTRAKEQEIYRQKYCGCIFSKTESVEKQPKLP